MEVLDELNITQMELARHLNKKPGYVSRLIKEYRQPRSDLLVQLARVLGVEVAWLAAEDGPKRTEKTPPAADFAQPMRKLSRATAGATPASTTAAIDQERTVQTPVRRPTVGTFVPDEEDYPNLYRAIETARGLGVPEEVLQRVATVRLKSDHDLSFEQWMEFIRQEYWQYKNGIERETPEEETDRTLREMMEGSTGLIGDAQKRAAEYDEEIAQEQAKRGK